jgi:hypothetical protein
VIDAVPAVRIAEAEEKEPLVKTTDPVGIGLPTPSATVTATETDCDDRILKAAGVTLTIGTPGCAVSCSVDDKLDLYALSPG